MFNKPQAHIPVHLPEYAPAHDAGDMRASLPEFQTWALQQSIPEGFENAVTARIGEAVYLHGACRKMWMQKRGLLEQLEGGLRNTAISPSQRLQSEFAEEFKNQTVRISRTAARCNAWGEAALIAVTAGASGDFFLGGHFSAELVGIAMGIIRVLTETHPERLEALRPVERPAGEGPDPEGIRANINLAAEHIQDGLSVIYLEKIIEDLNQGSDRQRLNAASVLSSLTPEQEMIFSYIRGRVLTDFNQAPDIERLEAIADFFTKQIMIQAKVVPHLHAGQVAVFCHLLESVSRYMGSDYASVWLKGLRDGVAEEIPDEPEEQPGCEGETATVEAMDKALQIFAELEKTPGLDDFDDFPLPILGDGPYACETRTAYSVEREKVSHRTPELAEARILQAEGRHEDAIAKLGEIARPWKDVGREDGQPQVARAYEFLLNCDFDDAVAAAAEIEDPDYRADVLAQIALSGARLQLGPDRVALLFKEAADTAADTASLEITAHIQTDLYESASAEEAGMNRDELKDRALEICGRIIEQIREETLGAMINRPGESSESYAYRLLRVAELQFRLGERDKAFETLKLADEVPVELSSRYDISGQALLTLVLAREYEEAGSWLEERYRDEIMRREALPGSLWLSELIPTDIDEKLPYLDAVSEAVSMVTREALDIMHGEFISAGGVWRSR